MTHAWCANVPRFVAPRMWLGAGLFDQLDRAAVDRVAAALGNTRAVCRKCYIHPAVLDAYVAGLTIGRISAKARTPRGLRQVEARLIELLQHTSARKAA